MGTDMSTETTGTSIKIEMDRDLEPGTAVALDAEGTTLAVIRPPHERPPPGTRTLVMSIEVWGQMMRAYAEMVR